MNAKSKFLNLDCMDAEQGLPSYPDNFFDLAIVDPPYGIDVQNQRVNSSRATYKWKNPKKYGYKTFDDSGAPDAGYFSELFRVSRNQVIWGANYFTKHLPPSKGWIVWDKKVNPKEHLSMCEMAYSSFDVRAKIGRFLWAGFKKAYQETRIHPTQKPVKLYQWLLTEYAQQGDLILDTHVGSASSLIAFESMGFNYHAFEIDEDYYKAARHRMAAGIQSAIF